MFLCVHFQWQHEDVLSPNNQPLSVSIPPRSVILSNMKKKLYKLSQDEAAIVAIQVSNHTTHYRDDAKLEFLDSLITLMQRSFPE